MSLINNAIRVKKFDSLMPYVKKQGNKKFFFQQIILIFALPNKYRS